jgi:DtxR family Mn-dependent transcriptional regulator
MTVQELSHSAQDYLEAVYVLADKDGMTRVKEVAEHLDVKKPSVVTAMKALMKKGLVHHQHYGYLGLTPRGQAMARDIHHRHQILFRFLHQILDVPLETAEADACRLEHHISQETLSQLVKFVEFTDTFPNRENAPKWLCFFKKFSKTGEAPPCTNDLTRNCSLNMTTLKDVPIGKKACITKVGGNAVLKKRLLTMGVVPGTEVSVDNVAPLGDPLDVALKGFHLSLRKEEAQYIDVEIL